MRIKFLSIMLIVSTLGLAQSRDFESWTSLGLQYKHKSVWTFSLKEQMRLDKNSSEIKGLLTQLGAKYKLNDHFELVSALRFINKNDNEGKKQGYEHFIRYQLGLKYKYKFDRLALSSVVRVQHRKAFEDKTDTKDDLRLKLEADYNISNWKFDPEVSGELFNSLDTSADRPTSYRLSIGTSFKLANHGKIALYYLYEKELKALEPATADVLSLKYTYSIQ
ncbi:MAG: DUF2490 domain-containing protein [Flavobacteriales bacterium]